MCVWGGGRQCCGPGRPGWLWSAGGCRGVLAAAGPALPGPTACRHARPSATARHSAAQHTAQAPPAPAPTPTSTHQLHGKVGLLRAIAQERVAVTCPVARESKRSSRSVTRSGGFSGAPRCGAAGCSGCRRCAAPRRRRQLTEVGALRPPPTPTPTPPPHPTTTAPRHLRDVAEAQQLHAKHVLVVAAGAQQGDRERRGAARDCEPLCEGAVGRRACAEVGSAPPAQQAHAALGPAPAVRLHPATPVPLTQWFSACRPPGTAGMDREVGRAGGCRWVWCWAGGLHRGPACETAPRLPCLPRKQQACCTLHPAPFTRTTACSIRRSSCFTQSAEAAAAILRVVSGLVGVE